MPNIGGNWILFSDVKGISFDQFIYLELFDDVSFDDLLFEELFFYFVCDLAVDLS